MTIIVDTREQRPWSFTSATMPGTLDAGDYSVAGLTHLIAIERKSLPDLLACCGHGRDRFKRELQRMRAYRFRALIIEAGLSDIEAGQWRSQLKPSHVAGALASWSATYELPVWLAGDPEQASRLCERLLQSYVRVLARLVDAVVDATRETADETTGSAPCVTAG